MSHQECTSLPGMLILTVNAQGGLVTAERSKLCDTMSFVKLYDRNKGEFSGGNKNL